MTKRPSITTRCPADRYSAPGERIAEISFPTGEGCLLSVRTLHDGTCVVDIYRADPGIEVRAKYPRPQA